MKFFPQVLHGNFELQARALHNNYYHCSPEQRSLENLVSLIGCQAWSASLFTTRLYRYGYQALGIAQKAVPIKVQKNG